MLKSLGSVASYNLLNGGVDKASINVAKAKKLNAIFNHGDISRKIIVNIQNSWVRKESAYQQIQNLTVYVNKNEQVIHDYTIQFQIGKRQLFNVLDAQREQYLATTALVNAQYDAKIAEYQLLADMGFIAEVILSNKS